MAFAFSPQGISAFGNYSSPGIIGEDSAVGLGGLSMPDLSTIGQSTLPSLGGVNAGGGQGWFGIDGLGKNLDTLQLGLKGLGTLGGLWASLQAASIAKKQLSFARATTNANLANQTQAYNTSIADRARARGFTEGQSPGQVADYVAQNSLQQRHV